MINKLNTIKRYIGQKIDQLLAVFWKRMRPLNQVVFDGEARFALVTVNFSTTYYLKLMLLTLCEQNDLDRISKIIIVDNNSKDGGIEFLQNLSDSIEKIELIKNNVVCTHARGVRVGVDYLDKLESKNEKKSNVLMVCDTDIIFRNKETLYDLTSIFESSDAAFAGELRYSDTVCPQAQASFLCIRRDVYARKDIKPFVNHGSPAYWMQKSLWDADLHLHDFHSNFGGYILHRGRTGVAAAKEHHRLSSFAKTSNNQAHYMSVENGEQIWKKIEKCYTHLLKKDNETELIELLSKFLN